ncbi:blue light receptor [Dinochytrium kinnereticum]|nr:blue light receptor [Dinochytrium kinnereticum]
MGPPPPPPPTLGHGHLPHEGFGVDGARREDREDAGRRRKDSPPEGGGKRRRDDDYGFTNTKKRSTGRRNGVGRPSAMIDVQPDSSSVSSSFSSSSVPVPPPTSTPPPPPPPSQTPPVAASTITLDSTLQPTLAAKKCEHCHTFESPEWRRGPTGPKTLCNACGLRYARNIAKLDSVAHGILAASAASSLASSGGVGGKGAAI